MFQAIITKTETRLRRSIDQICMQSRSSNKKIKGIVVANKNWWKSALTMTYIIRRNIKNVWLKKFKTNKISIKNKKKN